MEIAFLISPTTTNVLQDKMPQQCKRNKKLIEPQRKNRSFIYRAAITDGRGGIFHCHNLFSALERECRSTPSTLAHQGPAVYP